jgi:hypothetical protein
VEVLLKAVAFSRQIILDGGVALLTIRVEVGDERQQVQFRGRREDGGAEPVHCCRPALEVVPIAEILETC